MFDTIFHLPFSNTFRQISTFESLFRCVCLCFTASISSSLFAAEQDWSYCPSTQTTQPVTTGNTDGNKVRVSADVVETGSNDSMLFSGAVTLRQAGASLHANNITVFSNPRRIEANGAIEANNGEFLLRAESANLDPDSDKSQYLDVNYEFIPRHAYGKAELLDQTGKVLTMKNASYSTCPPEKRDWAFSAGAITLDQAKGFGYATQTLLEFKGIPLLYLPAVTFPITDKRRSGILYPTIGNSDETGVELGIPYYWNIAPAVDLQLTPRYMSKRGTMLENHFRYLGESFEGEFELDFLPDDQVTKDQRYYYRLLHEHEAARNWKILLKGGLVSDSEYFSTFSGNLSATSTTHIERRADFIYGSSHLNGLIRAQAFQTVSDDIAPDNRPYQRLPQITLEGRAPFESDHSNLSLSVDFTRFVHESLTNASRLDLKPTINFSWLSPAAYFKPEFSWNYTRYDFDEATGNSARDSLTRELPTTTIDSGLIFERSTKSGQIHTLEPRLYYLNTSFKAQEDIPVFDSDEPAFVFSSLFRKNRFSGIDRIGDANQLTLALSSRILKQNASEKFVASIGQIHYFKDRRVTLPGDSSRQENRSDLAAEVFFKPDSKWEMRGSVIADDQLDFARVATAKVAYRSNRHKIFNLEHRFHRDDDIDQTNLSTVWPINTNWRFIGRWLFSHESRDDLEILTGLEYETCCWMARLMNRRYIINDEGEYNSSFYVQLALKGLASFGTGRSILERSIPGYVLNED